MIYTLTLLFVTPVWTDWVEISQNHYRKPIRTHSAFATPDKVITVEETTKPWTYNNHSVTEYNWRKTPTRTPYTGNRKRVQIIGSTIKTTDRVKIEDEEHLLDVDVIDYDIKPSKEIIKPTKATIEIIENRKQKGTIQRVPNIGNVKRVQIDMTTVKSPTIRFKGDKEISANDRNEFEYHNDDLQTEVNKYVNKKNSEALHRRIYISQLKKSHVTEITTFPSNGEDRTQEITSLNKKDAMQAFTNYTALRTVYSTKPTFITESEDFIQKTGERFFTITDTETLNMNQKSKISSTERIIIEKDTVDKNNVKELTLDETTERYNIYKNTEDFATESHENKVHHTENEINPRDELITNPKVNNFKRKEDLQSQFKYQEENKKKKEDMPNRVKIDNNKLNTMENVIKFMRVVADTISRNSRRSVGGKLQYLHELKDSILANIEDRIDATWPDDDVTRRRSRSAQSSPRGHVHFPSSESALMTISFLTFAVFLIKLVLQVIQTYKNKAMMVAPLVVAAGRNAFTYGRH